MSWNSPTTLERTVLRKPTVLAIQIIRSSHDQIVSSTLINQLDSTAPCLRCARFNSARLSAPSLIDRVKPKAFQRLIGESHSCQWAWCSDRWFNPTFCWRSLHDWAWGRFCVVSLALILSRRIFRSTILYVGVQLLLFNSLHSVHSFTFILFSSLSHFKKIPEKYNKNNEKKERHKDETSTNNHLQKTMGEVILGNLTPLAKSIKH